MVKLKREIGFISVMLTGVGIILGAGIYALIGKVAGIAGNGMWMSFIIASVVALFSGLSYAELSSRFPKAGAEYVYTKNAFGLKIAFITGFMVTVAGLFSSSAVALGFGGYLEALTGFPALYSSILLITGLSFIVFYGVKESVMFAVIGTLIEAAGLIIIIMIGLPYIGSVNLMEYTSLYGIFQAAALIFFAYIGFEDMVRLSEETKDASRTVPKALVFSIAITTILYILVSVASVSVIGWEALSASGAPLADVASAALGPGAASVLGVIALFATGNTVLLLLLATSRIMYGMGRSYSVNNILAKVHERRRTPWAAILIVCIVTVFLALPGSIDTVANMTDFLLFLTFIAINASVIKLRFKETKKPDFLIPGSIGRVPVIPVLGIITCIGLTASMELSIGIMALIAVFIGFCIFIVLEKKGIKPDI